VSAQGQEPEYLDLSTIGFNEGSEETAAFGVIEFADFGCIHCSDFHQGSYPALYQEFVASGDILWKYVPVTLAGFPNSDLAGVSIHCGADLGTFGPLRDHLYARREEWMAAERSEAMFVGYATAVGIPALAFQSCLSNPETHVRLEQNNIMARQIGVTGTPTFIIAGNPVEGAPPLADFQAGLRGLVVQARAMAEPPAGTGPGGTAPTAPPSQNP
jgi:protein-disulfide isomerase